jgi:predicted RNA-binding Zn ribbon-like protein
MSDVELVVSFLNTGDGAPGADRLASRDGVAAWGAAQGLLAAGTWVDAPDVQQARELRDALHELVAGTGDGAFDACLARLPLAAWSEQGRLRVGSARGGAADLPAGVVEAVLRLQASGGWSRIKVCADPTCGRAFADRSRNRSRHWCDMATCGSRAKMRALRRRAAAVRAA